MINFLLLLLPASLPASVACIVPMNFSLYRPHRPPESWAERIFFSTWWQSFGPKYASVIRSLVRSLIRWVTGWLNISLLRQNSYYSLGGRGPTLCSILQSEQQSRLPRQRIYLFPRYCLHSLPSPPLLSLALFFWSLCSANLMWMVSLRCWQSHVVYPCVACPIITTTILFIASVLHYLFFSFDPFDVYIAFACALYPPSLPLSLDAFWFNFRNFIFMCACCVCTVQQLAFNVIKKSNGVVWSHSNAKTRKMCVCALCGNDIIWCADCSTYMIIIHVCWAPLWAAHYKRNYFIVVDCNTLFDVQLIERRQHNEPIANAEEKERKNPMATSEQ